MERRVIGNYHARCGLGEKPDELGYKSNNKKRVLNKHSPKFECENYIASFSTASSRVDTKKTSLPLLLS